MNQVLTVLLPALTMGLGWGIRGQFGHETGAMVPGALVGLALAAVSSRWPGSSEALRIGAVGALACSLGGLMTYGQTINLVQGDTRARTWKWGLFGLAVKGAVWIGLTGAFLGMAASDQPYSLSEIPLLCLVLAGLAWVGVHILNRPHDPANGLPVIYFSDRNAEHPRPEFWGGLWLALAGLIAYLAVVRSDRFAVGMALFGIAGGGLGFPLGECLQACGVHGAPFGLKAQKWLDWWKVMEVSFGCIAGAALGLGWLVLEPSAGRVWVIRPETSLGTEVALLGAWSAWLVAAEGGWRLANGVWEASFVATIIPTVFAFAGWVAPSFVVGPLLLLVSGDNVVRRWTNETGLAQPNRAWAVLVAAVAAFCLLAGHWVGERVEARGWLLLAMWTQVGIAMLWAVGSPEVFSQGWRRPRILAAGSQITVQAVFLLMAVLITGLVLTPIR